jgi:hypothetical protein
LFGGLAASCREPTEITLQVRTNLPCASDEKWKGAAVYLGEPGADVERASPTLVATACDSDGRIGSLVVVPSDSKSELLGVRVVAGITRKPEDCADADYQGCVVARRALRFTPHTPLELEIELTADCVSVGCDPTHTCFSGACVDTQEVESQPTSAEPVPEPSVRCGDDGVRCGTTGKVCCLTVDTAAGTTRGDCRLPADCPKDDVVLICDDDSDCPRDPQTDIPGICDLAFEGTDLYAPGKVSLSQCRFATNMSTFSSAGLALCEKRQPCADAQFPCGASGGSPNPLPGYFWCRWAVQQ